MAAAFTGDRCEEDAQAPLALSWKTPGLVAFMDLARTPEPVSPPASEKLPLARSGAHRGVPGDHSGFAAELNGNSISPSLRETGGLIAARTRKSPCSPSCASCICREPTSPDVERGKGRRTTTPAPQYACS